MKRKFWIVLMMAVSVLAGGVEMLRGQWRRREHQGNNRV